VVLSVDDSKPGVRAGFGRKTRVTYYCYLGLLYTTIQAMRKKLYWANIASYAFLVISAVVFTYVVGYVNGIKNGRESVPYPILTQVRGLLEQFHLGGLPAEQDLDYGAVRGLLSALKDPYTVFLEPPSQELETQNLQGEFGGIGVGLRRNDNGEVALSPFPDYPAIQAGVIEGDILIAIDNNVIVPDTTLDQISAWARGLVGTTVKITFRHPGQESKEVTLTRVKVEIPSVTGRLLDEDQTIGLVALSRFSEKTPAETQSTIASLMAKGAKSIVLDLRGNGGGLLDSGIGTASLFLQDGVIMYEDRQGEPEKTYSVSAAGADANLPLAVIVNHGTASAAEILAGALRDRGRAPLIGQTTYGKGSVQLIFQLADNSSVHITNARWYTPKRAPLDGVGLKPDYEIEPGVNGNDPELAKAVEYLQSLK
jgi:carboxyl-terminal processing protease